MNGETEQVTPVGDRESGDAWLSREARALTRTQEGLLQGLWQAGGRLPYREVPRVVYGRRTADVPGRARAGLGVSLRGLEQKRLVEVTRNWGAGAWGQPVLVALTDRGRALAQWLTRGRGAAQAA